jgi:hypothetical protein
MTVIAIVREENTVSRPPSDLYDRFCFYCQREYVSVTALEHHLQRKHPGTHAQVLLAPNHDQMETP